MNQKGMFYDELEEFARGKIRNHLQDLLEQEVDRMVGREKNERKLNPLEQLGYRNFWGKASAQREVARGIRAVGRVR
jgi:hypothetical protein